MSSIRRSHRSRFAFALKSILGMAALGTLAACGTSSNAQSSDSAAGNSASAMPAPTVSLKASEASVPAGSSVTLQWNAANADNCAGSGGWSGTMPPTGSTMTPSLTDDTSYTLTCTGAGGTAAQTVSVKVAWAPSVKFKVDPATVTSIQDQTLSYVPRIIVVGLTIVLTLGFSLQQGVAFARRMIAYAAGVEGGS